METLSNGKFLSKDEIREIFGPPPSRKPIPSSSFNTLVRIFSLFSDENPFSHYSSYVNLPEYLRPHDHNHVKRRNLGNVHDDSIVDRGEKESSEKLVGFGIVAGISSCSDTNNYVAARVPCKDDYLSGSNELDKMRCTTKLVDRACSNEEPLDGRIADVQKIPGASVSENILTDESGDMNLMRLPEKDVSFDFLSNLGSISDIDVCVDSIVTDRSRKIKLTVEGDMKEDAASEVRNKGSEANQLAPESFPVNDPGYPALDKEMSDCLEVKDQRRCTEKVTSGLSELEGQRYSVQKCNTKGALVLSSNPANSTDKGNGSVVLAKGKSKRGKKASLNDVASAKHKHISVQGEALNSTKFKNVEPLIQEKMVKKHEVGHVGKSSTKKVKDGQDQGNKSLRYTREQLLRLQNISVSEDILRASQEIAADVHFVGEHSAAVETRVISDANKGKQSFSKDDKSTEEGKLDTSILKKKKRGTSSEARKEKKKLKRRKKRAELNKKLGVKRLKLKPVLKPKAVSLCRHYLNGRCHEGEKCKFSHDVIPLTKSKPCCHFARNACMKGDECPFDHQLSKYPCNNYVTTGFCIRGGSCSFSHKAPPAEHAEPVSLVSHPDSSSLHHLDESNSKKKFNASTTLASGSATPNSLKGNPVRLASQPASAPKGISFLSIENSSAEDSSKHRGGKLFQQNSGLPKLDVGSSLKRSDDGIGTIEHTGRLLCVSKGDSNSLLPLNASNSKQTLNDNTSLESGYAMPNSLHRISVGLTSQPANVPEGIDSLSYRNPSVEESSKRKGELSQQDNVLPNEAVGSSSKRSDNGAGTNKQLSQGLSSRAVNFSKMFKVNQVPSSSGLSYVSSGEKSANRMHTDFLIGEIGTVNDSDKLKTVQPEDSSTSLGLCSAKVGGVINTPSAAVKSLSSTLAFAEKYGSMMKMSSMANPKLFDKYGINSQSTNNEESKASAILQFLYSGRNKEQA